MTTDSMVELETVCADYEPLRSDSVAVLKILLLSILMMLRSIRYIKFIDT